MVPIAGSAYTYAYATLGEFVAWVIGWDLILEYGISAAPVASSWSGYVQDLLRSVGLVLPPVLQSAPADFSWHALFHIGALHVALPYVTTIDLVAAIGVLGISALLALGIRESAGTNAFFVALQVLAFFVFIIGCWAAVHPQNFHPFMPNGFHSIVQSAALVFFAYIGFDTVTVAAEESVNPQRDVPIGVIGSLLIGGVLYMIIAYITVGIVPWQHISSNDAMSQAARMAHNYAPFVFIVTVGAIAGNISVMLTSLLGQTRIFYVMARDRLLPRYVAEVHPRFRTPARMTMITGIVVAVLAAVIPIEKLLALVNIGTLSAFSIVCAGVFILRFTQPNAVRHYRAPLGPLVAILGVISCVFLMFDGLNWPTWVRFVVWFVVGVTIYCLYGFRHSLLARGNGSATNAHMMRDSS
jgi:APA family basic amino acid/polyamine antiporter